MLNPQDRMKERKNEGKSEIPEDGERTEFVTQEQRCALAVVGFERYRSSGKGTPGILVRFVTLNGPEPGKAAERTFWDTPNAIGQFLDFVLALGHTEPFDHTNDDVLNGIFTKNAVNCSIQGEGWVDRDGNERTTYRPAFFSVFKGKPASSWNPLVEKGEEGWDRYVKWRTNNPRPEPGSGGGGGGGGGQGGGGGGGGGGQGGGRYSDEIPF